MTGSDPVYKPVDPQFKAISPPSNMLWVRLFVYVFVLLVEMVVLGSQLAYIETSWFARWHTKPGDPRPDCDRNPELEACKRGASDFAFWNGLMAGTSGLITVFTSVAFGTASDALGRRSVLIFKAVANLLRALALAAVVLRDMSLWIYFCAEAMDGFIEVKGVVIAMFADLTRHAPHRRGPVYGTAILVLVATMGLIYPLAAQLTYRTAVVIGCVAAALHLLISFCILPETSLGVEDSCVDRVQPPGLTALFQTYAILNRNSFMRRLACVLVLNIFAHAGSRAVLQPYLMSRFGIHKSQQATLLLTMMPSIAICMSIGLWVLVPRLGEVKVIQYSFLFNVAFTSVPLFAGALWQLCAFNAVLAGPGLMLIPVINAVKSNLVNDHEQGQVQGLIAAMMTFSVSVSHAVFGALYQGTTRGGEDTSGGLICIWLAVLLTCGAAALAWTLPSEYPAACQSGSGEGDRNDNSEEAVELAHG